MERIRHIDILRCVAIILVVIGHVGSVPGCGLIEHFFPIYSYHLALFLFISGYLFKDINWTDFKSFVWRKTKNLLIPLIGWNIAYAVIVTFFNNILATEYFPSIGQTWTFHNLFIEPFLSGQQYIFNSATWFVGMLYVALLVYALIHILSKRLPDYCLLVLYLCLGIIGLLIARTPFPHWALLPLHLSYALFFIQLGRCWKKYIEPILPRVNILLTMMIIVAIWLVAQLFGGHVNMLVFMNFEGHFIIPFIAGTMGCAFWMLASGVIAKYVKPNIIEKQIGGNTWAIMTHHLFVRYLICGIFVVLSKNPNAAIDFKNDFWYIPGNVDYWTLILLMVAIPVLWQIVFDHCCKYTKKLLIKTT